MVVNNRLEQTRANRFKQYWLRVFQNRFLLFLAIPATIYFIMFCYVPMYGIVIGFQQFKMKFGLTFYENIAASKWVGLKHIQDYVQSMYFWRNLRNTFLLFFYSLIFGFPLPILFALLLNELKKSSTRKLVQTISYLPHFISTVAVCSMVTMFLSPQSGIVNTILKAFGGESIYFLAEPAYFRTIYVITDIWQSLGWNSIVYLAAISTIDTAMYEAATIDGANRWQNMWYITLPHLLPTVSILLILRVGGVLNEGGEKVLLLYTPTTYETADVISSFIYRRGLEDSNFSYSTAVGLFTTIVNVIFILTCNFITGKITENSLF